MSCFLFVFLNRSLLSQKASSFTASPSQSGFTKPSETRINTSKIRFCFIY